MKGGEACGYLLNGYVGGWIDGLMSSSRSRPSALSIGLSSRPIDLLRPLQTQDFYLGRIFLDR